MIELSIEIVKIVIFLIPGILSMIILERLTTHKKIEFDRFATYSIVLAFFIYIFDFILITMLFLLYKEELSYHYHQLLPMVFQVF